LERLRKHFCHTGDSGCVNIQRLPTVRRLIF